MSPELLMKRGRQTQQSPPITSLARLLAIVFHWLENLVTLIFASVIL